MQKSVRAAVIVTLACLVAYGCSKKEQQQPVAPPPADTSKPVDTTKHVDTTIHQPDTFVRYYIKAGNNYCEKNSYPAFSQSGVRFKAILDSSCIYTTKDPDNQADINKLYGFGDCYTHHQTNSARFGWNWYKGEMRIHAYCYVGTVRNYVELGTVKINQEFDCQLFVKPSEYTFVLNGKTTTMQRGCTDTIALGYKLFPYFGGDEPAPHNITVRIREY